jgi:hypothetical protein
VTLFLHDVGSIVSLISTIGPSNVGAKGTRCLALIGSGTVPSPSMTSSHGDPLTEQRLVYDCSTNTSKTNVDDLPWLLNKHFRERRIRSSLWVALAVGLSTSQDGNKGLQRVRPSKLWHDEFMVVEI